jgi:hypothetical protein
LEDVGGQIISLQSEYISAISEIANSSLGEEAKKQAIAELTEYYKERIEFTSSEYDKAVNNNAELYYTDWTNYSELTNYKISDTELFGTTF